jgi:hypothetical protein
MSDTNEDTAPHPVDTAEHRRKRELSLARQFGYASSTVLVIGMVAIGLWVTNRIEEAVTQNTGASSALYVDSFVTPLIQELARTDIISEDTRHKLDQLLGQTPLGKSIVSFKIWKEGGLVAYSSRPDIIGHRFTPTPNLQHAWNGTVSAEFDTLEDDEDALERSAGVPLLEIYSPVREIGTGRIIAVSEFYSVASNFKDDLVWTRIETWIVVAAVTLTMLGLLFGIVLRGSRTIDMQRRALETQIDDLSMLLRQNETLRARIQRASKRTSENMENFLRRIGSELHDGPAQFLAVASLRVDALKPLVEARTGSDGERSDLAIIRDSLAEALAEIRQICSGLMLPELNSLAPRALLVNAVAAHERRTRSAVELDIDGAPNSMPRPFKICVYRFVQETLNNASRHADGAGQKVSCRCEGGTIEVTVSDTGSGFDPAQVEAGSRLGLRGLRERVESLGGTMTVDSVPGAGTRITMRANFQPGRDEDDD